MRTAVFVDAGYLYAAGSKLLSGIALPRTAVQLDLDAALRSLRHAVEASSRPRLSSASIGTTACLAPDPRPSSSGLPTPMMSSSAWALSPTRDGRRALTH